MHPHVMLVIGSAACCEMTYKKAVFTGGRSTHTGDELLWRRTDATTEQRGREVTARGPAAWGLLNNSSGVSHGPG